MKQTNTGLWLALLAIALSPLACSFDPYPDLEGFEACSDDGSCAVDTCSCVDPWGVCAPNDPKDPPESCHPIESVCLEDSDCLLVMPGACPHQCIDGQCLPPDWVVDGQTHPIGDPNLRLSFTFDHDDAVGDANGVKDDSGNANHGTLGSGSYVPGLDGQAVALDGSSGIFVQASLSLQDADGLTLEAWIRPNSLPTESERAGIIDKSGQYGLFLYAGGELRCLAGEILVLGDSVEIDRWTHVACAINPALNTATIYIDGIEVAGSTEDMVLNASGSNVVVGANEPSGDYFDGDLDSVRIWNRALSSSDMCWTSKP